MLCPVNEVTSRKKDERKKRKIKENREKEKNKTRNKKDRTRCHRIDIHDAHLDWKSFINIREELHATLLNGMWSKLS